MAGVEFDHIALARVMASKILGPDPEIPMVVIDFTTREAIEGPYRQIDAREDGRIVIFTQFTVGRLVEQILQEIIDEIRRR